MRAIRLASTFAAAALAASLVAAGCSKAVPTQGDLPPSTPAGTDANAGQLAHDRAQRRRPRSPSRRRRP